MKIKNIKRSNKIFINLHRIGCPFIKSLRILKFLKPTKIKIFQNI